MLRVAFALLLGFVLGAGAAGYALRTGVADVFIRKTEVVEDLQRRLHDVEQERDQLGRQLADVVARAGRMESAFTDIEKRFHDLQAQLEQARGGAHAAE